MPILYEVFGEGRTIIFTHGWMMSRKVWERQRPLSDNFRLIYWDLPKEGSQGKPLYLADCALALQDLLSQLKVTEATYVGWSMGMSVFWKYLEMYGEGRFKNVVNVEMVPKMDPNITMVEAVEKSFRRNREHAVRKFVSRIFYDLEGQKKGSLLEDFIRDALLLPLDSILNVYREMAEADFRGVVSRFQGKQRLIFGRRGFYADKDDLLHFFFPNDPIDWFENSAHAPFWEEAEKFNSMLTAWF